MFDLFRSRQKSVRYLLGALLLMVAFSMVITLIPGYGSTTTSGNDDSVLATIGTQKLTSQEVDRSRADLFGFGRKVERGLASRWEGAVVGLERSIDHQVTADRQRPAASRRRGADHLHAFAARQHRAEDRTLAVDPLAGRAGDLGGEAAQQEIVDVRAFDPSHSDLTRPLDPHFARPVDHHLGDVGLVEEDGERTEVGA